ncbi:hypothetical protein CTM44_09545 [Prevotella intermedia]|nr:hypothetical protein CTM44_09545 [Prevotella intermedia]
MFIRINYYSDNYFIKCNVTNKNPNCQTFRDIFSKEAISIHIEATSTQLSQTSNIHCFFGLLLSMHRCWCH